MPTRQSVLRRGTDRGRAIVGQLCREAEVARLERGTSYAELGRALGIGGGQVARICRGQSPAVSVVRLAQLHALLGRELSARSFPVALAIRDTAQVRLLERLRRRTASTLPWRFEVPVTELPTAGSTDHRAWDAAIDGPRWTVRVEAETHVGDLQAVLRRVALKQRDSEVDAVLLLLAETRHHRQLLIEARDYLAAAFPVSQRQALSALRRGLPPAGNALVVL